jgi:predicted TPR repeat methyltransferase
MRLLHDAVLVLAVFTALLTAASATDPEALEKRFKEANAKFDTGEVQAALDAYNEILEAEPKARNGN